MDPEPVKMAAANFATAMARLAPRAKKILFTESLPCDMRISEILKKGKAIKTGAFLDTNYIC
jgi:hypothetical protein